MQEKIEKRLSVGVFGLALAVFVCRIGVAENMDFEKAIALRDEIKKLSGKK